MLDDLDEFPATPEQLSNDYHYQMQIRHGSETVSSESGWMRQAIRSINADESASLNALWQVREDYYPYGGSSSHARQWKLGHDSIDRVWSLFAVKVDANGSQTSDGNSTDTEWLRYSAEGAGERGLVFAHSPIATGESYPEQLVRWPGESGTHELTASVSVRETVKTHTRAGEIEAYRFSLEAKSDDGRTVLNYRYWINPKLGMVRETVLLEEPNPDNQDSHIVTSIERELEDYYNLLE